MAGSGFSSAGNKCVPQQTFIEDFLSQLLSFIFLLTYLFGFCLISTRPPSFLCFSWFINFNYVRFVVVEFIRGLLIFECSFVV
jgi:hypothetical protein